VDRATGEIRDVYSTDGEPDDVLLVACGSRRAARCRSCASWYRRDAFHLVAARASGWARGFPTRWKSHPKVFATFTAPSFGAVHTRRIKGRKTLPLSAPRQGQGLPAWGTGGAASVPACRGRSGHRDAAVFWSASTLRARSSGTPWRLRSGTRTWTYFSRELAGVMGMSHRKLVGLVKPRMVKVAEYQRRGGGALPRHHPPGRRSSGR